jgi:hypothetical protein
MKTGTKLSGAIFLLGAPLTAFADTVPSTGHLYSFVGGFAGGLIGAGLACWFCKRRDSKRDTELKKY